MKKYLLTACLLTALPVQAQMFDFSNMVQPIQISEEFVNNLTTCTPFEETKDTEFMGFDMHVTSNIKGKENDECMVAMYSETMGINSLQPCHVCAGFALCVGKHGVHGRRFAENDEKRKMAVGDEYDDG